MSVVTVPVARTPMRVVRRRLVADGKLVEIG